MCLTLHTRKELAVPLVAKQHIGGQWIPCTGPLPHPPEAAGQVGRPWSQQNLGHEVGSSAEIE